MKMHTFTTQGMILNGIGGSGKSFMFSLLIPIIKMLKMNYTILTPTACAK